MDRPITTLFMLMSLDGKISPGASDALDVDKDFPKIDGLKEGLPQYYEIEQTTDLWSFNTGRVQEKMGVNQKPYPDKTPVSFVLLDNNHLTEHGVTYFCKKSQVFVLITSNKDHPAYNIKENNLHSGGTVNGLFLREKLFDYIDVVVAPVLIGGKETSSLIDGSSILSENELSELGVLKLIDCTVLNDSYIRVRYQVIN